MYLGEPGSFRQNGQGINASPKRWQHSWKSEQGEALPRSGRTGKGEQEKVLGRENTGQEQEQGWLTQETARNRKMLRSEGYSRRRNPPASLGRGSTEKSKTWRSRFTQLPPERCTNLPKMHQQTKAGSRIYS